MSRERNQPNRPVVRATLALAAVVICAWFALGTSEASRIDAASSIADRGSSAGARQLARASSLLRTAGWLNPDRNVEILRGRLAIARHRFPDAIRILGRVTRDEPLNLEGWIWLAGAGLVEPGVARDATRHIAELDPRDLRRR